MPTVAVGLGAGVGDGGAGVATGSGGGGVAWSATGAGGAGGGGGSVARGAAGASAGVTAVAVGVGGAAVAVSGGRVLDGPGVGDASTGAVGCPWADDGAEPPSRRRRTTAATPSRSSAGSLAPMYDGAARAVLSVAIERAWSRSRRNTISIVNTPSARGRQRGPATFVLLPPLTVACSAGRSRTQRWRSPGRYQ